MKPENHHQVKREITVIKGLSCEPVNNLNQSYKQRSDNLRLSSSLGASSLSRLRDGIAGKESDS